MNQAASDRRQPFGPSTSLVFVTSFRYCASAAAAFSATWNIQSLHLSYVLLLLLLLLSLRVITATCRSEMLNFIRPALAKLMGSSPQIPSYLHFLREQVVQISLVFCLELACLDGYSTVTHRAYAESRHGASIPPTVFNLHAALVIPRHERSASRHQHGCAATRYDSCVQITRLLLPSIQEWLQLSRLPSLLRFQPSSSLSHTHEDSNWQYLRRL